MTSCLRSLFTLSLLTITACTEAPVEDELTADDASEGLDDAKADGTGTYTYYFIEQDERRCPSPMCGGTFYRLANATKTTCIDGTKQERCYAASTDWSFTNLDDTGLAKLDAAPGSRLVRATIRKKDWGFGLGIYGELRPREVWGGQLPVEHDGVLVKVEHSGVRCATTPCPFFRERKLNSSVRASVAELGWDASDATDEQIGAALEQMYDPGLIIAGNRFTVSGPGGKAKGRTVTQFWMRATNDQCPIIDCAAPPMGCQYEGAVFEPCGFQTCGTLVCDPGAPF
ncbi:MAG: DUF6748 domain-containing protein [Kofleriaceae bacterium]